MGARGSITLGHIRRIRIGVDYSWFIVLFLVILWLSSFYKDILNEPENQVGPYLLAVGSALAFFASILLHELGHALVAIRNGVGITSINLWMFGGVARMQQDSPNPSTELKIAVAGPAVTLLIALACGAAGVLFAGSEEFWRAMRVEGDADTSGILALVAWLASINMLVLLFNLIPAYPMDGGRIVRAIAWWRTGDRNSATRFAATIGRGFAYLFIGFGVFLAVQGDVVGGIWLAVIGFIISQSASAAAVQTSVSSKIEGISVADVMDSEPVAIPDTTSVERALDEYFLRYRWPWFPVVDAARRFRGLVQRAAADDVPEERRTSALVSELLSDDEPGVRVRDDAPLESLLGNEHLRRLGGLIAVDAEGRVSGVITLDQVGRAVKGALSGPSAG